eukprot:CAMPEP_0181314666 /NCGR_PEP_ID=MMETSP1101-20121128/14943_1 /TAXON_ID=46948 /ORGANISM="Rhodomonas abbreviata, Strain Caron Lab Isolate" /LENGTH=314 /DNA_ID=CAMNT_0023421781 /DNA_START=19 /DNA_END=961 /DNA_ORIENTATION=+
MFYSSRHLNVHRGSSAVELLGNGANIYATLERPVENFVSDLPYDDSQLSSSSSNAHEDRVMRKLRRLRAEEHKLNDDKQQIIDRLTKERDDAQLEVGRASVDKHKLTLQGSIGRVARKEWGAYERALSASEHQQRHNKNWVQYWMHKKEQREDRIKELDAMLRHGPGAVYPEMSAEEKLKHSREHCLTVKKMLDELEGQAHSVDDVGERDPLLEQIEKIRKVVENCGTEHGGMPRQVGDKTLNNGFNKYVANLLAHSPKALDGSSLSPKVAGGVGAAAPWWDGRRRGRSGDQQHGRAAAAAAEAAVVEGKVERE